MVGVVVEVGVEVEVEVGVEVEVVVEVGVEVEVEVVMSTPKGSKKQDKPQSPILDKDDEYPHEHVYRCQDCDEIAYSYESVRKEFDHIYEAALCDCHTKEHQVCDKCQIIRPFLCRATSLSIGGEYLRAALLPQPEPQESTTTDATLSPSNLRERIEAIDLDWLINPATEFTIHYMPSRIAQKIVDSLLQLYEETKK